MNEVLKINYETEQPTVSARELHEALGVASRFSRWFDSNKELFVEGEDYNKCTSSKAKFIFNISNSCFNKTMYRIGEEVGTISRLPEFSFEAMEVYKKTLDLTQATRI